MLSAICFNLDQSKILLSSNGLKQVPSFLNLILVFSETFNPKSNNCCHFRYVAIFPGILDIYDSVKETVG